MNKKISSAVFALALLLAPETFWAHHSYSVVFDASTTFMLTGTLTNVDFRNPHIQLSIDANTDGDKLESWVVEGAPPTFFVRQGITKATFEKAIGQTITVEAYRARDGSPTCAALRVTFEDGTSVANDPSV